MSLDWNLTRCKDDASLRDEANWPTTKAIIFETMFVGIGELTEKTIEEFKVRSDFFRKINDYEPIPMEELRRRIGLSTNVFPMETSKQFVNRHWESFRRSTFWSLNMDKKSEERVAS